MSWLVQRTTDPGRHRFATLIVPTPFERSRSHGRRYACLLAEALTSTVGTHDAEGVCFRAMLKYIWNLDSAVPQHLSAGSLQIES